MPRVSLPSAGRAGFALLAAAAVAAPAAEAARLRAVPPSATVSAEEGAELRLSLDLAGPEGSPRSGLVFLAESNFGSVGPVKEVEPGRYQALLQLPPTDMPRAAVVVFSAQESESVELHHAVVPVVVETFLRARTEPRSEISIQVAGRQWGPVQAGRAGWFTLSFLQPPGTRSAEVVVIDTAGNVERSTLPVPRRPHDPLTVTLDRYRARTDGTGRVKVHALLFDEEGRPIADARLEGSADRGQLGDFVDHGDGVHAAEWRAPADGQEGVATLRLRYRRGGAVHEETERIRLERGPPGRLALSAEPNELVAGEQREVRLQLLVQDAAGNGLAGEPVRLSADRGTLDELRSLGEGRYESRLVAPEDVGSGSIEVKALLATGAPSRPPVRVDLSANPEVVPTSWRAFSLLTATLTDEAGAPVAGEVVLFHLARGEGVVTPAAVTNADGRAFADFSADPTEEVVVVEATSTSVPSLKGETRIEKRASGEFAIINRPALAAQGGRATGVVELSGDERVLQDSVLISMRPGAPAALSLAADPALLVADGASTSRVTALLSDARGNEIPGAEVRFAVDEGTIGEGSNVGDGRYLAVYTSPKGAGSGRATVTATEMASGLSASAVIELEVGPPARLALELDRDELPADGASQALVTATVEDASGTPVPDALVRFRTEGPDAELDPSAHAGPDGRAESILTAGHQPGSLVVVAETGEGLSARVELELLPTSPVSLRLRSSPASILANGIEVSQLEALLEDAFGRPVADHRVEFDLLSGPGRLATTAPVRTDALGEARIRLSSTEPGRARVRARSVERPSLSDETEVELRLAALSAAFEVDRPACEGAVVLRSSSSADLAHEWDWTGDGLADATGATVSAALAAGTRRVRLTVRDAEGGAAAVEQDVEVAERPLAVAGATSSQVASGGCTTLDGEDSAAADGGVLGYSWDTDGDGDEDLAGATVSWCAPDGMRRARLTVTDSTGCTASDEVDVSFGDLPALTVSLSAPGAPSPVPAGSAFELELRWANAGRGIAPQSVVGMELSSELVLAGTLPAGGQDLGGGRFNFPLGDLAGTSNGSFRVPVRATPEPAVPSSLARVVASARHQVAGGQSTPVVASLSLPIVPVVDLAVSCSGPADAAPGALVDLLVELRNDGASTAPDAALDLEWDASELVLLASSPAGTGSAGALRLAWPELAAGGLERVELSFRVGASFPVLANLARLTASATLTGSDVRPGNDACEHGLSVTATPDAWLSVRASPERSPARPGDTILFDLSYGNRGSAPAEASVIEGRFDRGIFTSSLVENPDSGLFSASDGTIRFFTGRIPSEPTTVKHVRYRVRVGDGLPAGELLARTEVEIRHAAADAAPGDDLDSVVVSLESAPDLALVAELPAGAAAGSVVPVSLSIASTGDVPAEGVSVVHEMSGALAQVVAASLPPGSLVLPSGAVQFPVGDLAIGAVTTLRYQLRLADVQPAIDPTLASRWTASFGGAGAALQRVVDRDLPVSAAPALSLVLELSADNAAAGDRLEATATLSASGTAPQPAGSLDLEWPANLFVGPPPTGLPFPSLAPGDLRVLGPFSLDVQPILPSTSTLASVTARVSGSGVAGTDQVELSAAPQLSLRIDSAPTEVAAGGALDLLVACRNDGTTSATAVELGLSELPGLATLVQAFDPPSVALGTLPADGVERIVPIRALLAGSVPACRSPLALEPFARMAESVSTLLGPSSSTDVLGEPDLRLQLSAVPSSDPPGPGDFVSYEIRLTNVGDAPALSPSVVLDRDLALLPDALPPLPSGASLSGSLATVPFPDLAPGQELRRTLRVRVATVLPQPTNRATVSAEASELSCETRTGDNFVDVSLNVGAVADVVVAMDVRADPPDLPAGGSLGLSLYLSNPGTTRADDVELVLDYAAGLVDHLSDDGGADSASPGRLTWSGLSLPSGAPPQRIDVALELLSELPSVSNLLALSARASTTSPENRLDNNVADASRTARAHADLCVELTATPVPVPAAVSGRLEYRLVVRNDGTTPARGTIVRLDYDAGLLTPQGSGGGDPLEWAVGDIAPGGSVALDAIFRIVNTIPGGTATATALATAIAPEHDAWGQAACDASARTDTVITEEADLALDKQVSWSDPQLVRGSVLQYTIVVENVGNTDANAGALPVGRVEDLVPAGLLVRSAGGGSWDGTVLSWDLPSRIRRGDAWTATYELEIDSALPPGLHRPTNVARVIPALADASPSNDSDSVSVEFRFDVDLSSTLRCTPRPAPAVPGSLLDYELEVVNLGSYDATNVRVDLDAGALLLLEPPLSGAIDAVAGPASLPPQGRWTYRFSARSLEAFADPITSVEMTAKAEADQAEADPANNRATASCNVLSSADMRAGLSVTELDASPPVEPGELLDLGIALENVGSRIESGVELLVEYDPLLASFESGAAFSPDGAGRLRHVLGGPSDPRDPPAMLGLRLRVVDTLPTLLESLPLCVTVSSVGPDVFPADNVDCTQVQLFATPDLRITRSVATVSDPARPGEAISHEVRIENVGTAGASGVVLEHRRDASRTTGLLPGSASHPGVNAGDRILLTVGSVPPGPAGAVLVRYQVGLQASMPDIDNTVTSTACALLDEGDANPADNCAPLGVAAEAPPDAWVALRVEPSSGLEAGDGATAFIDYGNAGSSPVFAPELRLELDPSLLLADGGGGHAGPLVLPGLASLAPGEARQEVVPLRIGATLPSPSFTAELTARLLHRDTARDASPADDAATVGVDLVGRVELVASARLLAPSSPVAGDSLDFELGWRNDGTTTASNASLDIVPDPLLLAADGSVPLSPDTRALGDLAPGASGTLLVTYRLPDTLPSESTLLSLLGNLASASPEADLVNNSARVDLAVTATPDLRVLSLDLVATPSPAAAGGLIQATARHDNHGTTIARDTTLTFTFDDALASLEDAGGGTPVGANQVVFDLGTLPVTTNVAATATIGLRVHDVLPALNNPLTITAEASASNETAPLDDNAAVQFPTVLAEPDLVAGLRVESSEPDPAACGGTVTWIASVANQGSTAAPQTLLSVSWDDALVGGVVSSDGANSVAPDSAEWDLASIAPGQPPVERRLVLQVAGLLPSRSNRLDATALASSLASDADPANNTWTEGLDVAAGVDLVLSALAEPATPVAEGSFAFYTYELINTGCTPAMDPCVETPYDSAVLSHWLGGQDLGGSVRTCASGPLAPGDPPRRRVVTFQVVAPGTGEVRREIPRTHVAFETGLSAADDQNPADNQQSTNLTACYLSVVISSPNPPTTCMGSALTLVAEASVDSGLSYQWLAPNGGSFDDPNAPFVVFTPPAAAGVYPVHVRISHDSGCTATTETGGQFFPVRVVSDCSSCGCHPANLRLRYVDGSLERVDLPGSRTVSAGETVSLRLRVDDTGTGKSATIGTGTTLRFADSQGHVYLASLAYPVFYECRSSVVLTFEASDVPVGMVLGNYRPSLVIDSIDACGNGGPRNTNVSDSISVVVPFQRSVDPGIDFSDWGPRRAGR